MAYVYKHIRTDLDMPFYIGIGSDSEGKNLRAYDKNNRSKFWKRIVNKTTYRVEIVIDNLTWEEACTQEITLIKYYGRRNLGLGPLVNLTDGGEGTLNVVTSEYTRQLKSKMSLNRIYSSAFAMKVSNSKKLAVTNEQKNLVLNTTTGVYYYSVIEAAEAFNIKYTTLYGKLTGFRTNNTDLRIV